MYECSDFDSELHSMELFRQLSIQRFLGHIGPEYDASIDFSATVHRGITQRVPHCTAKSHMPPTSVKIFRQFSSLKCYGIFWKDQRNE